MTKKVSKAMRIIQPKVIHNNLADANFTDLYKQWSQLSIVKKEESMLSFTLAPTPPKWIRYIEFKDKYGRDQKIPYIPSGVAKRLLNLFFGVANWSLEIQQVFKEAGTTAIVGYLVVTWFDGSQRRIPTAGAGKILKKNPITSEGDDTKAAISDAIKKGMANMGFFSDIYGGLDMIEEDEKTPEDTTGKPIPKEKLIEALEKLETDVMEGVEGVNARLKAAEKIIKSSPYNDLKERFNKLIESIS